MLSPLQSQSPSSFDSSSDDPSPRGRGHKVANGRLVKPRPPTSTRSLPPSALNSPLAQEEKVWKGDRDNYDDGNNANDNDNDNDYVNASEKPPKHSKNSSGNKIWKLMKRISTGGLRDKDAAGAAAPIAGGSGGGGGIPGSSRSLSRAAQLRGTKLSNYSEESLSFLHQSNGSFGSLVASSTSHGESSAGPPLSASASASASTSAINTFSLDQTPPPPVPAIPKDLQIPQCHHHLLQIPNLSPSPSVTSSLSSPVSSSFSEPGPNVLRKPHQRDRGSRSPSSAVPSPLSPGQLSHSSTDPASPISSPPLSAPAPTQSKKRILSRISSVGLLRRKPSIPSGLGFGTSTTGTSDKVEKSGKIEKIEYNERANSEVATVVPEVPALPTIPTIPSIPSRSLIPSTIASKAPKPKSNKYSISCIPISSIPSMPSLSISSSTPSTPIRSTSTPTMQITSFSSSSSSRPGTGKTTISQSSSSVSSPRLSLDSRSRSRPQSRSPGMLAVQSERRSKRRRRRRSKSMSRSRSRSNSLDSLGRRNYHHEHDHHAYLTTPTNKNKKNDFNDWINHRNNNNNHNHNGTPPDIIFMNSDDDNDDNDNNNDPYSLSKHIVPPLELSATLEDDNRWGVEHVLVGDGDHRSSGVTTSSSPVSFIGHINARSGNSSPSLGRQDRNSLDPGLGSKRSPLTSSLLEEERNKVNRREEKMAGADKWERMLERGGRWDKAELDKLDGLRRNNAVADDAATHARRESWHVRLSEHEEVPSLPVPPRKKRKEREGHKGKEKESPSITEEKWDRGTGMDVLLASAVSSSPVYRGRAIVDDNNGVLSSTFGRVMGKQIEAEGCLDESRHSSSSSLVRGRASFSAIGDGGRDSRKKKSAREDESRQRRSLSAVRSASSFFSSPSSVSSKDGQSSSLALALPRSWTRSFSSPTTQKKSSETAMVVDSTTPPVPANPPRAFGTLLRKLSFSGASSSGTDKRPRRPPTASSSTPSGKSKSISISHAKGASFWDGGSDDKGELESSISPPPLHHPRKLQRKNSLPKGRSGGIGDHHPSLPPPAAAAPLDIRKARTDYAAGAGIASTSTNHYDGTSGNSPPPLTEKERWERWEYLLERSEKAGGTIHLHAHGEGLLSDTMRMSTMSTASTAAQVSFVQEEEEEEG